MTKRKKQNPSPGDTFKLSRKSALQPQRGKTVLYPGVYVEEVPSGVRTISRIETSITAFIGQAGMGPFNDPVTITSFSEFENVFGNLQAGNSLGYSVRDFFLNGGGKAVVIRVGANATLLTSDDFIGPENQTDKTGLYALERVDLFNLLVIPPYNGGGDVDTSVIAEAAAYCERRRAFMIMDPPASWTTVSLAAAGISTLGTSSENAAVYFPSVRQPDPLQQNALSIFPPAGAIAGIYARTDAKRGIWKAPAGFEATMKGVQDFTITLSDQENRVLNSLGINSLRSQPSSGPVVWGSRTLQGGDAYSSEWKYVPVRRTALFIEESLYRGTAWTVFEPNNETLWAQLRLSVNAFMQDLFRQGAFQGAASKEAYFVKCGTDTTTVNDIADRRVNLLVGFAPLKPAEFVVLQLTLKSG
ncbi:MAG: phage tail sheath subtilisin-like domain-containing protein [Verrucomicrobiae bacterium]|nr:phage tail sheath subtilisin-like domain-containing protein [Verrucomicrobiae bacterium]